MAHGTHPATEVLTREECTYLLQYKSYVGRVGFTIGGRPQILPVNYLGEDGSVVVCTEDGSIVSTLGNGTLVAFEVDHVEPLDNAGWSVLVQGVAREVTDSDELVRLRRGPLRSWVAPGSAWIRISIDEISGRRIARR